MRLTTYLLLFTCFCYAENSHSQNVRVNLNKQQSLLREVLEEIEEQTDYLFISNREIDLEQEISVNMKDKPVREVLQRVFDNTDISYAMEGVNIILYKRPDTENTQQNRHRISGTVVDIYGDAIIGANVMEDGTSNGTITDINGNFSLNVSPNAVIAVTFIGYVTQEISVQDKNDFNIVLKEDAKALDEVVVIGYGTMRKKDLTGSVVQIRPDNLANQNPQIVQDILRNTPGLEVGFDTSAKGGGTIQIRGQRSVYTANNHNSPLLILDGMPFFGELSEINPDDIGQIDILKDASAASIYGAKSANGVIIITTKKGKNGKPIINVSTNVGWSQLSSHRENFSTGGYLQHRQDWLTSKTYGVNPDTGAYEAYQAGNIGNGYYDRADRLPAGVSIEEWRAYTANSEDESDLSIWARRLGFKDNALENLLAGKTVNWRKKAFRTGLNQDYNASVSGANERANYYLSLGYLKNEGVRASDDYRAIRANMKVSLSVTDWLEIGANVNFQDRSDGNIDLDVPQTLRNSPYGDYYDADGNVQQYPLPSYSQKGYNYDFQKQYLELEKGYTVLNTILNARIKLPYNITYSFNASPRYQFFYDRWFQSAELPGVQPQDQGANREQTKRFDWSLNNTINWDYTFNNKHHVAVTLVQEAEEQESWKDRIEARVILPSDALGFHNTKNGTKEYSTFSSTDTHHTATALLARLFYSYDDRYMVTGSIRRDGYSAFGQSNPYANFPATAVAWTFTNEKFFKWHDIMDFGKLRLSYGENGNRSLDNPYIALSNLSEGGGNMHGYYNDKGEQELLRYLMAERMANPNLRWEKTASWNLAVDFGFFNSRLSGTIEYYLMKTHDMIMEQRIPEFTGFPKIATNLGQVNNTGVEISLHSQNIVNRNFRWDTSFGFSYNKNQIKHLYYEYEDVLDENGNVIGRKEMDDTTNGWFIGQPISAIWNYRVTGIWQLDEVEEAAKYGQRPGDPKVANLYTADDVVNADGTVTPVYNDKDKEILGQTSPPYRLSLRNEFTLWRDLSISFNIYGYLGHKSLSNYYLNDDDNGGFMEFAMASIPKKEYWTIDNPTNKYGRIDAKGPVGAQSPGKLYNRSFFRLENISVGYTLPKKWTSKVDIDAVKVYGSIRNVAVWAKDWEYGDPEIYSGTNTIGYAARTFSLGLNLTF